MDLEEYIEWKIWDLKDNLEQAMGWDGTEEEEKECSIELNLIYEIKKELIKNGLLAKVK